MRSLTNGVCIKLLTTGFIRYNQPTANTPRQPTWRKHLHHRPTLSQTKRRDQAEVWCYLHNDLHVGNDRLVMSVVLKAAPWALSDRCLPYGRSIDPSCRAPDASRNEIIAALISSPFLRHLPAPNIAFQFKQPVYLTLLDLFL
jgi:hypothetical protein